MLTHAVRDDMRDNFLNLWNFTKQVQVEVLIIFKFYRCDLILMHSTNSDQCYLITHALMQIACWPIQKVWEKGIGCMGGRGGMGGETGEIVSAVSPSATDSWNTLLH
jgi:hypothetical protein